MTQRQVLFASAMCHGNNQLAYLRAGQPQEDDNDEGITFNPLDYWQKE